MSRIKDLWEQAQKNLEKMTMEAQIMLPVDANDIRGI